MTTKSKNPSIDDKPIGYSEEVVGGDTGLGKKKGASIQRASSKKRVLDSKSADLIAQAGKIFDQFTQEHDLTDKDALKKLEIEGNLATLQNKIGKIRNKEVTKKLASFAHILITKISGYEGDISEEKIYKFLAKKSKSHVSKELLASRLGSYLIFQKYYNQTDNVLVGVIEFRMEQEKWLRFLSHRTTINDLTSPIKAFTDGLIVLGQQTANCMGFTNEVLNEDTQAPQPPHLESLSILRMGEVGPRPYTGYWSGISFLNFMPYVSKTILVQIRNENHLKSIRQDFEKPSPEILNVHDKNSFLKNKFINEVVREHLKSHSTRNILELLDTNKAPVIFYT